MSDWLIPYIVFNGNCEEAVKFYREVLGGELTIMHYGDAPPNPAFQVPDHAKNLVLHAELRHNGHVVRFCDNFPGSSFSTGSNISFSLEFENPEQTRAMFGALSEGGVVGMELQQTFFSPLYAKCTDKFGVLWQLSTKP